jgi:membrane protease YdiL (CAAX protease family)
MTFENDPLLPPDVSQHAEADGEAAPRRFTADQPSPAELAPAGLQVPEDIRVPWDWGDLVLFVVIYFVGIILIGLLTGAGFAVFGISPEQLRSSTTYKGLFVILTQVILSVAVLVYLVAQMRYRFGVPAWKTIGWRPMETAGVPRPYTHLKYVVAGFLLSMVLQLASASFPTKTKLPIEDVFQDRRSAILLMLTAVTIAPLVEETIFRGYIYPVIARSFGVRTSILVTGTLFGMSHAAQLWGGWAQIALLVLVGIIFTYARSQARTVVASYLVHLGYNAFLLMAFVVATHGMRNIPGGP